MFHTWMVWDMIVPLLPARGDERTDTNEGEGSRPGVNSPVQRPGPTPRAAARCGAGLRRGRCAGGHRPTLPGADDAAGASERLGGAKRGFGTMMSVHTCLKP